MKAERPGVTTETSTKKAALEAWKNATNGMELSALMVAIGEAIQATPDTDKDFSASHQLYRFAKRIAQTDKHGDVSAMDYGTDFQGEWEVTNADLDIWGTFRMWLGRYGGDDNVLVDAFTQNISAALRNKRLWQAFERYQKTGLTKEHCTLLQNLLWNVNTGRGDGISIYVQGKRPFGNSSISYDIYEHAGWPLDWPEDDGMSPAQSERAWNLFDELIFAAPDAAKVASANLSNDRVGVVERQKYLPLIAKLRGAMKAAKRLAAANYTNWNNAGGGKECEHGYNEGIPCPACDLALLNECLDTEKGEHQNSEISAGAN